MLLKKQQNQLKTSVTKFDSTVEVAFKLGVNPKYADQQVRGALVLPHGTGKSKSVLVFAKGAKVQEAEAAGADYVGGEELVAKIQGGWTDFEVCVATPDMMGVVGRLGKILGPKGLMPNPKVGTVTMDVTVLSTKLKPVKSNIVLIKLVMFKLLLVRLLLPNNNCWKTTSLWSIL